MKYLRISFIYLPFRAYLLYVYVCIFIKLLVAVGVPKVEAQINWFVGLSEQAVIVVAVVSHIQRIVLATEATTVTQQVSHRPIKCQSSLWSQRGTKVNGSHRGDNPLLRPAVQKNNKVRPTATGPQKCKMKHENFLISAAITLYFFVVCAPL